MKYKAIILGCGRIAGGFDHPGDPLVLTHAHAISRSLKIELVGVYDVDKSVSKAMAEKWKTTSFDSPEQILGKGADIIVIAVPDEFHEEMLEVILPYAPRLVVCEKPIGKDIPRLQAILGKYKERDIKIAVNFRRNFDKRLIRLKKEIEEGLFGDYLSGVCFYSKGLRHNGSHAIAMLTFLFGEFGGHKILDKRFDHGLDDPTVDVQIQFKDGKKFYLLAGDESKYSIFEWQFLFARKRLIFKRDGFEVCEQNVIDDPIFRGYKALDREHCDDSDLQNSMLTLYENVAGCLDHNEALLCDAQDGLDTQMIIEAILQDKGNS